jgi:hypothetical protein
MFVPLLASAQEAPRFGSSPNDATNAFCIEKVQFPTYTPLARNAALQGSIVVTLTVAVDGAVEKFDADARLNNERATGVLLAPVEYALRKSQFRRDCHGKQVTLVFEFRITGDASDRVQQETAFGYPIGSGTHRGLAI